jgi:hypothetical protein
MRNNAVLVVMAGVLSGCAAITGQTREPAYVGNGPGGILLPPYVIFQDSTGPVSYRATVGTTGPFREVRGEACQSSLTFPTALVWGAIKGGNTANASAFLSAGWGDGGYAEAVSAALQGTRGAQLVDARADLHTRIILGIWRQQCVRIVGSVAATNGGR